MSTTESPALAKLHETFRFISYLLLFLSIYLTCMDFFGESGFYLKGLELFFEKLARLKFLSDVYLSKIVSLSFLIITCIGTTAQKNREIRVSSIVAQVFMGLFLYWGSLLFVDIHAGLYIGASIIGFIVLNVGFDNVSKLINVQLMKDRFNTENESFS